VDVIEDVIEGDGEGGLCDFCWGGGSLKSDNCGLVSEDDLRCGGVGRGEGPGAIGGGVVGA